MLTNKHTVHIKNINNNLCKLKKINSQGHVNKYVEKNRWNRLLTELSTLSTKEWWELNWLKIVYVIKKSGYNMGFFMSVLEYVNN